MIYSFGITLCGIILCGASAYFCFERAHKPHDNPEPRLIPWRFLALLSAVIGLLLVAKIFNSLGFETGPDKSPFGRFH
ncbi:hypothetical protein Hbal_1836 [Hirschia baltica ATCC 49814]|uniref:Uncharacterized protein n=1 Tax=Hirschia baltica (strain ATCC 49814 / DSM 5838 / IFAM 1418) TaxID=582402 RepID=C6XK77_HIRBI|nr:hypothetical protein Hbal_1836 [Hirschia baltica ATCC 49814]